MLLCETKNFVVGYMMFDGFNGLGEMVFYYCVIFIVMSHLINKLN